MSRRPTPPARRAAPRAAPPAPAPGPRPAVRRAAARPAGRAAAPAGATASAPSRSGGTRTATAREHVVSRASAARFAARARARRWLTWRPVLVALGVLAAAGLAGWVLLASPLLAVRELGVVGTQRIDAQQVRALLEPTLGTPLARVGASAVEERVAALPLVKDVDVVRAWPSTLEVRIVERVPIAAVPTDDGVSLVDVDAVVIAEVPEAPADLPLLEVPLAAGPATLRAASGVLAALPTDLRADVEQIGASTPDDVRLRLRGGAEVVWGGPADSDLKADVLQALRTREAAVYDVSAPLTPVTR
ncbi:MAG: cell division protein FtsQ/DivIB [Actinomycetes bacterium]